MYEQSKKKIHLDDFDFSNRIVDPSSWPDASPPSHPARLVSSSADDATAQAGLVASGC